MMFDIKEDYRLIPRYSVPHGLAALSIDNQTMMVLSGRLELGSAARSRA
jgi:hypothetical protein